MIPSLLIKRKCLLQSAGEDMFIILFVFVVTSLRAIQESHTSTLKTCCSHNRVIQRYDIGVAG